MDRIVECVPNFSEGRDRGVIDAIAKSIQDTPGCVLLDVDAGRSTHRTVYTFVGDPCAVVEGALAAARVARARIDMRTHAGEHPRLGALDVCPFVPVAGVTMDDCVACAREFGRRAAEELGIPVYLYEAASSREHRKSLSQIRAGEYEGLAERIRRAEWAPDFGPAELVPAWGATVTGARGFLIAYNVNVLGTKEQAHRIALDVREQGRGPDQLGRLRAVKAIGWWVEEYNLAQVSMNLDDHTITPLHAAYEACVEQARGLNVGIAGSEIVGLVPRQAILGAADYYIARENLLMVDEGQKIRLAVQRLGLSSVAPFDPGKRIIEYLLDAAGSQPLAGMTVRKFIEVLGSRAPAPGGGSASALMASLGAALGAMMGWTTYGRRKFEEKDAVMRRAIPPLHRAMTELVPMIDADTRAFNDYMAALGLPAHTPAEAEERARALQASLKRAVEVPLATMRLADACWDALEELAAHGNLASSSDLEVGAKGLEAGIWGAGRNVLTNLDALEDAGFQAQARRDAQEMAARAQERFARVMEILEARPRG